MGNVNIGSYFLTVVCLIAGAVFSSPATAASWSGTARTITATALPPASIT